LNVTQCYQLKLLGTSEDVKLHFFCTIVSEGEIVFLNVQLMTILIISVGFIHSIMSQQYRTENMFGLRWATWAFFMFDTQTTSGENWWKLNDKGSKHSIILFYVYIFWKIDNDKIFFFRTSSDFYGICISFVGSVKFSPFLLLLELLTASRLDAILRYIMVKLLILSLTKVIGQKFHAYCSALNHLIHIIHFEIFQKESQF